ncbi:SymE family type I addiction module toxin [Paraburkholderia bonniea]|uniref:SymE family type I addiction module toxin n=1 Tax=Paraburkholderia bonniea TaxID=2152891 RepID=UPI001FEC5148|nr:SymE family type I addiction module toxin [Paraburkholderia bonniea]WJF90440.1 SymE family type I addiction module toxin [Paraburkholderia bonniea]WJF93755.1 SymE family type I addiction module toxin [Paraburkholderia bonniea]
MEAISQVSAGPKIPGQVNVSDCTVSTVIKALHAYSEHYATVPEIMRWRSSPKQGRPWRTPTFVPWLCIAGKWLEQAGIDLGQRVRIEIQHGRLVTTPD